MNELTKGQQQESAWQLVITNAPFSFLLSKGRVLKLSKDESY